MRSEVGVTMLAALAPARLARQLLAVAAFQQSTGYTPPMCHLHPLPLPVTRPVGWLPVSGLLLIAVFGISCDTRRAKHAKRALDRFPDLRKKFCGV